MGLGRRELRFARFIRQIVPCRERISALPVDRSPLDSIPRAYKMVTMTGLCFWRGLPHVFAGCVSLPPSALDYQLADLLRHVWFSSHPTAARKWVASCDR